MKNKKYIKSIIETIFILLFIIMEITMTAYYYHKDKVLDNFIKEHENDELKTLYYTDMDTCVLYMTNEKGISVMLDKNSKVMLDQECLLSKEGVEE